MARQKAQNILQQNGTDEELLLETLEGVLENFELSAVSLAIKAQPITFDGASAEYKRFVNSVSQPYGTARTAGKGELLKVKPVYVKTDIRKEIVEEFTGFDVDTYGVPRLLERRADNHFRSMVRELDTAFFKEAYEVGTVYAPTATSVEGIVEELIVKIETISNDFIDGVDRDDIVIVVNNTKASLLRNKIDTLLIEGNRIENGLLGKFHGVDIYTSNRLPKGTLQVVDMFGMVRGAVAQPVKPPKQYLAEKIPLSDDWAVQLFFNYGTDALMEDTIFYVGDKYVAA